MTGCVFFSFAVLLISFALSLMDSIPLSLVPAWFTIEAVCICSELREECQRYCRCGLRGFREPYGLSRGGGGDWTEGHHVVLAEPLLRSITARASRLLRSAGEKTFSVRFFIEEFSGLGHIDGGYDVSGSGASIKICIGRYSVSPLQTALLWRDPTGPEGRVVRSRRGGGCTESHRQTVVPRARHWSRLEFHWSQRLLPGYRRCGANPSDVGAPAAVHFPRRPPHPSLWMHVARHHDARGWLDEGSAEDRANAHGWKTAARQGGGHVSCGRGFHSTARFGDVRSCLWSSFRENMHRYVVVWWNN